MTCTLVVSVITTRALLLFGPTPLKSHIQAKVIRYVLSSINPILREPDTVYSRFHCSTAWCMTCLWRLLCVLQCQGVWRDLPEWILHLHFPHPDLEYLKYDHKWIVRICKRLLLMKNCG
jgi:hypothetical protein